MNTPVDFSTAKLLKEKGFDEYCKLCVEEGDERPLPFNAGNTLHKNSLHPYYSTPTIAEVVMWLYEKYGIWIQGPFPYNDGKWEWVIFLLKEPLNGTDGYKNIMSLHHHPYKFNSPTEAYEAAIEYTLKTLYYEIQTN